MTSVVIVLCLLTSLLCLAAGNKGRRWDRIEDRLEEVEDRLDRANIARREDVAELSLRMDDIETLVNNTAMGLVSVEPGQSAKDGSQISNELLVVQNAFAEEKSRWRRDASEMENKLKQDVNDVLEISDREMKSEIRSLQNSIHDTKAALENSDGKMKTEIQSLQNSINAIKDTLESSEEKCSQNSISLALVLDKLKDMEKLTEERISKLQKPEPTISSCLEIYRSGVHTSGVYDIKSASGMGQIPVYCDMTTDGGGWTVFQRRRDGSEDFFRGWQDYVDGFGQLNGEFWLGNQHISSLTSTCCHELRIDLEDFEGNRAFAKYNKFKILPLEDNFRLEVSGYSGTAGDSLRYHNGMKFSTKDQDNDKRSTNCAQQFSGAWWYKYCYDSNLNGLYVHGDNTSGVVWSHWKNKYYSLKFTEMKFRPT